MFVGFRDRELVRRAASEVARRAGQRGFRIMHVCGTHEWSITHFGLREMLPTNVKVVAGPGCPVCVTPGGEIDVVAGLAARRKAVVTTFGDVLRVPGARSSLAEAKAEGGDVRVVYSVSDATRMARTEPEKEFVHFSIGFETTAPMAAMELIKGPPRNFSIYSSHKLIPPAMEFLLKSGAGIDGFICPGHVSTIIGARAYEPIALKYGKPMVISGFEPLDVVSGVLNIVTQVASGRAEVENEYTRAVRAEGNEIAMGAISKVFEPCDSFWRGIGMIKGSGLRVRGGYREHDACARHGIGAGGEEGMPEGCGCGDVLLGRVEPDECPLFGKACTPARPVGPCMVSSEGTCAIAFKYRKVR